MATVSEYASPVHAAPPPAATATESGLFGRLVRAVMAARQRQTDRKIGEILRRRGGIIRDSLESPGVDQRRGPFQRLPAMLPRT